MNPLLWLAYCCLPLKHLQLNSAYGYRVHPVTKQFKFHSGIDLKARGDTVFAISSGKVSIGYNSYLGVFSTVQDSSLKIIYGHLSALLLTEGPVAAGEPIGITGATGRVTGEHLHLAISYRNHPIDPLRFLYQLTLNKKHHE